jgi:hypothetical protein
MFYAEQGKNDGKSARVCGFQTERETADVAGWMGEWLDGWMTGYWLPFTRHLRQRNLFQGHQQTELSQTIPLHKTVFIFPSEKAKGNHSLTEAIYTGCPGRNVPDFGRMFLLLKYPDITQNTYIRS